VAEMHRSPSLMCAVAQLPLFGLHPFVFILPRPLDYLGKLSPPLPKISRPSPTSILSTSIVRDETPPVMRGKCYLLSARWSLLSATGTQERSSPHSSDCGSRKPKRPPAVDVSFNNCFVFFVWLHNLLHQFRPAVRPPLALPCFNQGVGHAHHSLLPFIMQPFCPRDSSPISKISFSLLGWPAQLSLGLFSLLLQLF